MNHRIEHNVLSLFEAIEQMFALILHVHTVIHTYSIFKLLTVFICTSIVCQPPEISQFSLLLVGGLRFEFLFLFLASYFPTVAEVDEKFGVIYQFYIS